MKTPYLVRPHGDADDIELATWPEVIDKVRELLAAGTVPSVYNLDQIDYDCDQDGYYACSNGLTREQDAELEALEDE